MYKVVINPYSESSSLKYDSIFIVDSDDRIVLVMSTHPDYTNEERIGLAEKIVNLLNSDISRVESTN